MLRLTHLLLAGSLLAATPTLAQALSPVPANYAFKDKAAYAQYAPQVVETVGWLEKCALPTSNNLRRQANMFLMEWMTGSPSVAIQLSPYLENLHQKDPDLLMAFLGGWTRYSILHPDDKDPVSLNTAGLQTMLTAYQTKGGKGHHKLNELLKLDAAGELPTWVRAHLKA